MSDYNKEILAALANTLLAYDQAILDLEHNDVPVGEMLNRWKRCGGSCRLCFAVENISPDRVLDCGLCPINDCIENYEGAGAALRAEETFDQMTGAFRWEEYPTRAALLDALNARRNTLIALADKNGIAV